MAYQLYDSFTTEEAGSIGRKFLAICKANYDYEPHLTYGKEYEIEIVARILPMSPLCKLTGDRGKEVVCHLTRFERDMYE